jgi:hypothetical protein
LDRRFIPLGRTPVRWQLQPNERRIRHMADGTLACLPLDEVSTRQVVHSPVQTL